MGATGCTDYDLSWASAEAAKDAGRLEEALRHYVASGEAARIHGNAELVDRALCNQAAVALEMGSGGNPIAGLREVLLRGSSVFNWAMAAKHIARAYELRREYRKGAFYARLSFRHAETVSRRDWQAIARNELANCLLGDSYFEEAAANYRDAVALLPAGDQGRKLTFLANLGFCEVMLGRHGAGLGLLYKCLRAALASQWERVEMIARIDLCFGLLQIGRPQEARRHGHRGLSLAEASRERDWIKNALYLLGQAAVLEGQLEEARASFEDLQRRFYPSQTHLADFLLCFDIRGLLNLRA